MGNPDTTTTTTGAATTTGPSAGRLKKTIRAVLEAGNYDPSLTFGQIRAKVAAQLQPKHPSFDFASPAFRAESKAVVAALIDEWQQQKQQQPQKQQQSAGTVTANDDAGGSNKRAAPQEEEDEQERRRRKKEKKKAKAMAAAPTAAPSSDPSDPVYKRLAKMAQAMGLAPAIYKGLKEIEDTGARTEELRQRLEAKGADFDVVPSIEQIKKAEAEWQLKKDLEGIDTSLILTGSRRRGAADAPAPTPTAPVSEERDKKEQKKPKAGAESSSEDEMEL